MDIIGESKPANVSETLSLSKRRSIKNLRGAIGESKPANASEILSRCQNDEASRNIIDIVYILIIYVIMIIIAMIMDICDQHNRTSPSVLPPDTIHQTPQPQQDIETGQTKILMFKDIEKAEGEGCGKRICPICLEEYEDDHEITRLNKCGHVFHRFCIDAWLTRDRSCPSCRRSVDLI
ncbi:hypothetical protein EUTSA_v10011984mg [Eutrema salsugineum]|uniref:RING-type E3 ubiquitin transferase n=1 Tax=Eutrema salsugineum TaxID=72664 RepID=V4MG22_EUTSA|nr:hypothetical protein EUTSA_v10011984mg [Eutrema salsugineum]